MKNIKNLWANKSSKGTKASVAALAVAVLSVGTVAAAPLHATSTISTLMGKATSILQDIYKGLLGIVTVLAVVICAWCFCVKMFSKNPRSIDEANQWMKRVAIAWLCFMLLSVFVAVGFDIVKSASANTTTPWDAPPTP